LQGPPSWLVEVLKEFAAEAEGVLGSVEVYLFSSYARGDRLEDSDVDLVVVSPAFKGSDVGRRCPLVRRLLPRDVGFEILTHSRRVPKKQKRRANAGLREPWKEVGRGTAEKFLLAEGDALNIVKEKLARSS
jgi:predicted nucleotidyltransferase